MPRKRLFAQLFPWFLFVALAPVVLVLAVTWKAVDEFNMERTRADLRARAELARSFLEPALSGDPATVDAACKRLGGASPGAQVPLRFTVIAPDGLVLGDSLEDPRRMESHAGRPEVRLALAGRIGESERFSDTLGIAQAYVAAPIYQGEAIVGAVRASLPIASIHGMVMRVSFRILIMGLLTALVSVGIGLYVSRQLTVPLEEMEKGAERFAAGDLAARISSPDSLEMAKLADALNRMAAQLNERFLAETHQRQEREAILASMNEGVMALTREQKVLGMNAAAAALLGVDAAKAPGRSLLELIRNPELERFVAEALRADKGLEGDLVLHEPKEIYLQLRGAPLKGADEARAGVVVVLSDVTRLRRLEAVRREFVSNASHELRTPITAIRGFAETLVEEAGRDPESVRRFAGIVEAHARRLGTLVDDMLTLSRLEHLSGSERLPLERAPVSRVLKAALAACEARAAERQVRLRLEAPEELELSLAPTLMEQAVINLLDNAIKYSEEGGEVVLAVAAEGDAVLIRVRDRGCGIEKRHLPRLFERFYRVDNARSRKLGGTGLGLAIVKHIVLAHGGEVGVASIPGAGSEFTIRLPGSQKDTNL